MRIASCAARSEGLTDGVILAVLGFATHCLIREEFEPLRREDKEDRARESGRDDMRGSKG